MKSACAVIDLGFGDGGKGMLVDNLVVRNGLGRDSTVVRFSGGQQCGHTVMPDAHCKHVFSSFGSGTFHGTPSYFTEETCMYLPALLNEARVLRDSFGIVPHLTLHPRCMMTTPYDVAYNRAKEAFHNPHGSCGLGVGATMKRCIETPYKTYAIEFLYPELLMSRLHSVSKYYNHLMRDDASLWKVYSDYLEELLQPFYDAMKKKLPFTFANTPDLNTHLVFEGSQGILLDMDYGVFPNVTYANTSSKNVWKKCEEWGVRLSDVYYVTRCYTTRHGLGWMPNVEELKTPLVNTEEEINVYNDWQADFRIKEFSADMINASLRFDDSFFRYATKKNFVLTCCDQRPDLDIRAIKRQVLGTDSFYVNNNPRRGLLI
jgi:adenylosuccinate synthase